MLDVPATIYEGPDGRVFDPIATHFGHSMKHYTNGLRDLGVNSLIGQVFEQRGAFVLGDLIETWLPRA